MEKVDILLATYNGEQYLREQLDSILNQSFEGFRLLISDDCSTDGTREILKEYKRKDPRIVLYFQKNNLGVVRNFEFLMKKVTSEYFMFSDQDDIWKDFKIEKSVEEIKKTNSDLVYSDLEVVDANLEVIYESYWKLKEIDQKIKKYNNFESLYLNNFVTGCTILARSSWIDKILPLPKTSKYILHDYWTALIISQTGQISYIEEPLIKYRQHKNNKIGSKKRSETMETLDDIRNLFITVKKEHFTIFVQNDRKFLSNIVKMLNSEALEYYEMLENTKNFNFKSWNLFFKLYKYENFKYKMENFLILNMPAIARILFKFMKKGKQDE